MNDKRKKEERSKRASGKMDTWIKRCLTQARASRLAVSSMFQTAAPICSLPGPWISTPLFSISIPWVSFLFFPLASPPAFPSLPLPSSPYAIPHPHIPHASIHHLSLPLSQSRSDHPPPPPSLRPPVSAGTGHGDPGSHTTEDRIDLKLQLSRTRVRSGWFW